PRIVRDATSLWHEPGITTAPRCSQRVYRKQLCPFGREAIGGIAVKSTVRRALRMGFASVGTPPA
ncbi:MAG: hypothetical protein IKI21_04475, partial [Oscillospiraceae bacterium]|nr:hypothetical protein [Oscillospiraceae bacterium]